MDTIHIEIFSSTEFNYLKRKMTTMPSLQPLLMPGDSLAMHPTNTTQPLSHKYSLTLVVILSALIPLTLFGNALVCVAFVKYKRLRNATNCFLFSLALSDLAVGLVLIPCWIAYTVTGFPGIPRSLDIAWMLLDITCSTASMSNLASVSIERWYGVSYPFRHMALDTSKATLMACFSWLYALATSLFFLARPRAWAVSVTTVLGVCLPFVVVVVSYVGIAAKIRGPKMTRGDEQAGRERKTIRTLVIVTAVFLVCWFPFVIGSLLVNYCEACAHYVNQRPVLMNFPKALHYSSSCVNPFLYALLSPSFKSAFKQLFGIGTPRGKGLSRGRNGSSLNQSLTTTKRFNLTASFNNKRGSCDSNRNSLLVRNSPLLEKTAV